MSKGLKKLLAVVLILAFAAGVWTLAAVSFSDVKSDFEAGDTVSASEFNDLFGAIDDNFLAAEDAINNRWGLSGNAGTDPASDFLGTSDAAPLEVRVDGQRALRLEPAANPLFAPSWIGGHANNEIQDDAVAATIAGGGWIDLPNVVSGNFGAIGGGQENTASGSGATIGGGQGNTASGSEATVGGGFGNTASGFSATVAGGVSNVAEGVGSFAAGRQAKALHSGSFVWGDNALVDIESTANNQFTALASGGVRFFSNEALSAGVELSAGGSSWNSVSDRNAKADLTPVDPADVLKRVLELGISEFSYRSQDESIRHLGPMAQDFYPLFGLGEDKLRISPMNLAGVSLAAIQGLHDELVRRDAEIAALRAELERERKATARRLDRLESLLSDCAESAGAP